MNARIFLLQLALLSVLFCFESVHGQASTQFPAKAIKDPQTGVIYYEESDRRHIAAISAEGKLLWCCEVLPFRDKGTLFITDFGVGGDKIWVSAFVGGMTSGAIDIKTGVFTGSGIVQ
jgi:hypothetical protein